MTRFYSFIVLCLLCVAVAVAVAVRDQAIAAEFADLRAAVRVLYSELESTNIEMTDQFSILGGKIYDLEQHVDALEYEIYRLKHPKPRVKPAPIRKRPVPAFAQGKMFGR